MVFKTFKSRAFVITFKVNKLEQERILENTRLNGYSSVSEFARHRLLELKSPFEVSIERRITLLEQSFNKIYSNKQL